MKQKLLEWLRGISPASNGRLEFYTEDGRKLTDLLGEADAIIETQKLEIEQLLVEVKALRHEVSVKDRMAQVLRDEFPALYKRYFTKAGAEDRAAGRQTKTGIKPKRRRT